MLAEQDALRVLGVTALLVVVGVTAAAGSNSYLSGPLGTLIRAGWWMAVAGLCIFVTGRSNLAWTLNAAQWILLLCLLGPACTHPLDPTARRRVGGRPRGFDEHRPD